MHYYDTYRNTVGIFFTVNNISVGTNYDANLEIYINRSIHRDPKNNWEVPLKIYIFCALRACPAEHPSAFTSRC